jgi:polyisoprenoid-binding protein YceI
MIRTRTFVRSLGVPVTLAVVLGALPAARAQAPAVTQYSVDTGASKVTYTMVHKLHKWDGTSRKAEGRARVLPDGKAQVGVRIPVESFDSANANRDAHMKETVQAATYPIVELKAVGDGVVAPAGGTGAVTRTFHCEISWHGVKQTMEIPVKMTFEADGKIRANAKFMVSLESFKIERPSLMFVKVDDSMALDVDLIFKK